MATVRLTRQPRIAFPAIGSSPLFPALTDVENRMSRFMENLSEPFADGFSHEAALIPATNIVEKADELTLTAELPGISLPDIDVSIDNGVMTISGEKIEERKEGDEDRKVFLYERTFGSFQRSFTLPSTVDSSAISAEFDKGVLKVHMPKSVEAKSKTRKIEVKTV